MVTADDIVLAALPAFVLLMAAEWAWGRWRGRDTYALDDTLASLGQGLLSQVVALLTPLFQLGLYTAVWHGLAGWHAAGAGFWASAAGWALAVVAFDFCDYWMHRASHEVALFWAAHIVHHQSRHFNLSTALRQEPLLGLVSWPFYLPMALAGVPPVQFAAAGMAVLVYQFWIHTEHIGRLGWLDGVLSTPSNHRVHHGTNARYLDRNYGAMLIVWDRLFGSFQAERDDEPARYGTVTPLQGHDPVGAIGQHLGLMLAAMRAMPRWRDKLQVPWRRPGWMPEGVSMPVPGPAVRVADRTASGPAGPWRRTAAVAAFLPAAALTLALLAAPEAWAPWLQALAGLVVLAALWACGRLLDRRAA